MPDAVIYPFEIKTLRMEFTRPKTDPDLNRSRRVRSLLFDISSRRNREWSLNFALVFTK